VSSLHLEEDRQSPGRRLGRLATIKLGVATPQCCLISDISADGVQVHLNGIEPVDEFGLLFSEDVLAQNGRFKVVWRSGNDVGARFVSDVTQNV